VEGDFVRIALIALVLFFALLDWLARARRERRDAERRGEQADVVLEEEVPPEWWDTGLPPEQEPEPLPERAADRFPEAVTERAAEGWTTVSPREERVPPSEPKVALPLPLRTSAGAPPPRGNRGDLTARAARPAPRSPHDRGGAHRRWIRNARDARRGIVMMIILGRPRGLDPPLRSR
jgi:hypothetical protein